MPLNDSSTTHTVARVGPVLGIGLAIVAGALLQLATCHESLWLDELHTAWTVHAPWACIINRAQAGNTPPLFFWLVAFVTGIAGDSEVALRLVSWLSSVALMILLSRVTWRYTHSTLLGILVVTLIALDPSCLFYAREARPYALLLLLGTLQVLAFWRRLATSSVPSRVAWIITTWLVFYTHYTGLLIITGELAYVAVTSGRWDKDRGQRWRDWGTDIVIIALGLIPAAWHLSEVGMRRENWRQFVTKRPFYATVTLFPCDVYIVQMLVWALFLWATAWWRGVHPVVWDRQGYVRKAGLLALLYFVPVTICWTLTDADITPIFFRRYIVVALIPLVLHVILIGSCFTDLRWQRTFALGAICLVLIHAVRLPREVWTEHGNEDWRSLVATLRTEATHDAFPVLLRAALIEDAALADHPSDALIEYCRFPLEATYDPGMPSSRIVPVPSREAPLPPWTLQRTMVQGGAWVVVRGDPARFEAQWNRWLGQWRSAGFHVWVSDTLRYQGLHLIHMTLSPVSREGAPVPAG